MTRERADLREPRVVLAVMVVAVALVVGAILAAARPASANFPTCGSNHSSFADVNCQDSGVVTNVRCASANLRAGPGIDFALHGSVVSGNNGNRWKIVFRSPAVNAGCGGLTTNEWWLIPIGWITRSALWN
jgi:hypothetical protein